MTTAVLQAERVVRRARSRLTRAAALDGAARGAVGGALAGLVAAAVGHFVAEVPTAFVALPFAGALLGVAWALRRPPTLDAAALSLDQAAATDEAFVTALTATDAVPWVRELTAERAVGRCDTAGVARFLPFTAPTAAAAAVVATALLAAVILVPAARDPEPTGAPASGGIQVTVPGGASGTASSPRARTAALTDAVKAGDEAATSAASAAVRADLGAVTESDLRALAESLAARGSDDARRALDALARGDRGAAIDALRAALGARDAGPSGSRPGGDTPGAAGADSPRRRDPWTSSSWPLRYDPAVRRYLEEIR